VQDSRVVVGGPRLLSESNVLVPSEVAKLTAAWLSEGKTFSMSSLKDDCSEPSQPKMRSDPIC